MEVARSAIMVMAFSLVGAQSCQSRSESGAGSQDTEREAPECVAYAADYERCLKGLTPDPEVAAKPAEITRESLLAAASDPSARDRVNEKCRVARAHLQMTCQ